MQWSLRPDAPNEVRRFGAGGIRMGADGATVGVRERCHRPIDAAPRDGTLIRFWCRSEAAPIVDYWSRAFGPATQP
jgi:hypothetical protein